MVTLTFVFNPEKVASVGSSEDELLNPMRDYARKYDISEDEYGVFSKDGEDAFLNLRQSAKENDLQDITLDEINAEIQLARKECL